MHTGLTSGTLSFPMPFTPGDYEFRFFVNGTWQREAVSGIVATLYDTALAVNGVASPTATVARAGSTVSIAVTNGPGSRSDWIGLFVPGAGDGNYRDYRYLNGTHTPPATGVTSATVSFPLLSTPGNYEFRLIANETGPRAAVSGIVTAVSDVATPTEPAAGTIAYYHTDAIGSVRMVTDASQAAVRYDYLPFGQEYPLEQAGQPRRFAGKERDQETNFDYFGARYYASHTGRFTTVDPVVDVERALVEPQLWNRYAYVTNNPFRFTDPDGRQREAALDRDVQALLAKQITVEEYNARIQARGVGAAAGALLAAGPMVWRTAVGCFLSPSCQSSAVEMLEGAAGGAPTSLNRSALLDDAVATSRAGVSKAGSALQSHSERGGWLAGEAMAGNHAKNTRAAKRVLEMVLERGQTTFGNHPTFGKVIKIRLPDGSGAWWKENGEFIGYLERYTPKQ